MLRIGDFSKLSKVTIKALFLMDIDIMRVINY